MLGPLQTVSNILHKWKERRKLENYLEQSLSHAIKVALVPDQVTGHTSTQFHLSSDPGFHTVKKYYFDSLWDVKASFKIQIGKIGK